MAITLSAAYLAEIRKGSNQPNTILEIALDGGTVKWGFGKDLGYALSTYDVLPIVKSISSLQNKLDPKTGYSTRGQITIVISGRDNFKNLIANNYLKNRRVVRKDGFLGIAYSDYAATFTGKITDWSRKGDELTLTVSDDLTDASKKLPVENTTKTQYLDYRNTNPVNIMTNLLVTQLGIGAGYVDSTKFGTERDTWLGGWAFDRVLTEPKAVDEYLNELQTETNSFIIHDGEKISYKVFAPPVPGSAPEEWTDNTHILSGSLSQKAGYKDGFYNRIVVYYDYDESGSDKEANFEAAVIASDAASQGAGQWAEISSKVVKSKWMRSRTYSQPVNAAGVVIYHCSRNNGTGTGVLTYTYAAGGSTLQWTAPGGSIGTAVKVTKDGKYQIFDADTTKYIRVIVTLASLAGSNKTDNIAITALGADTFAAALAQKLLNRYRDPASTVALDIDINNVAFGGVFIKPTDLKDITSDEAVEKGVSAWNKERVMITSVRPDKDKVSIEAIETRMYRRYGFIAPAGQANYPAATAAEKERAYIGDANNKVNAGTEDGYYVW